LSLARRPKSNKIKKGGGKKKSRALLIIEQPGGVRVDLIPGAQRKVTPQEQLLGAGSHRF